MSEYVYAGLPNPFTVSETTTTQYVFETALVSESISAPPPPPTPSTVPPQPQFALTSPMPNVVTRFTTISC
jgi:hypothetical protein